MVPTSPSAVVSNRVMTPHRLLAVLLVVTLLAVPFVVQSSFWLTFWTMTLLAAVLGQSWNILGGYGGQSSFGHAAFFGTGAYAAAILQVRFGVDARLAAIAAIGFGAIAGAAIGMLSFRYGLRGSYFALVTMAFAEVFRIIAVAWPLTGGGAGLNVPLHAGAATLQFVDRRGYYWAALALVAISIGLAAWLERSRFGAWLVALRENEAAAQALGINIFRVKLGAITLSAALAASAGVFYTQYFLYLDPGIAYGPGYSIEALLGPIIGGTGTVLGPLIGAISLHLLGRLATAATGGAPGLDLAFYGVLLIGILAFLPRGLTGLGAGVNWPSAWRRSRG
ncbi:MAG TPA: branched-chain amino acid ABC transporter permease [Stellaceae bacterium]|nr:branched-chain amino acid ABC transporter permease [Stellaceae bacterium]